MLVQFKMKNVLSFKEETIFDMTAISAYKEHPSNLIDIDTKEKFLRVAAIYGANASGKSNFVWALKLFRRIVSQSLNNVDDETESVLKKYSRPFSFEENKGNSEFEIVQILGDEEYQYGFEYNSEKIVTEWLYRKNLKANRKVMIFERAMQEVNLGASVRKKCEAYKEQIPSETLVLSFFNKPTIFNSGIGSLFTGVMSDYKVLIMAGVLVILVKIIIDLYLKTKSGLLLRASGSNPQFVTSLGRDSGKMKVLGLAIGNGLTALSGSILGQQSGSANINSGTGMVVMALASVIIGTTLFKKITIMKATTAVILGSILYKACLSIAMLIGLPTNYLKLLMAGIFAVVLISNNMLTGRRKKVYDNTKK